MKVLDGDTMVAGSGFPKNVKSFRNEGLFEQKRKTASQF